MESYVVTKSKIQAFFLDIARRRLYGAPQVCERDYPGGNGFSVPLEILIAASL